jgi:hypothetical protein
MRYKSSTFPERKGGNKSCLEQDGEDTLEFKDKHGEFPIGSDHLFSEHNEVTLLAQMRGSKHWSCVCCYLVLHFFQ